MNTTDAQRGDLGRRQCAYCPKRAQECGYCFEHDDAPPKPRPGIPHPGMGAAITLALAIFVAALGVLVAQFDARYDVQPSPAGPTVVEVGRP